MLITPLPVYLPPVQLSNLLVASRRLASGKQNPLILITLLLVYLLTTLSNLDLLYSEQGSIK
jgi:hypothetical protein